MPREISLKPAVVLLALLACAHASPGAQSPEVTWPEGAAVPRVRLAFTVPDPLVRRPRAPLWRRALNAFLGIEGGERADEQLVRPFGIAVGANGDVYVADPDAPNVWRVGPDHVPTAMACRGRKWAAPIAVNTAPDGALLVADAGAAAIVRIDATGGCSVLGAGSLERPTGVAALGDRVYVVDPPRHQLVALSPGSGVARFGERGEGAGELSFPTAVAATSDGTLLVVDALNFRIARFDPDGHWVGAFGTAGEDEGEFARPKGIATDASGRIYVSDAQRDLVLVFLADGTFDYAIGASGSEQGRFVHPAGLAIAGDRLYVADSQNRRVQVFDVLRGRP